LRAVNQLTIKLFFQRMHSLRRSRLRDLMLFCRFGKRAAGSDIAEDFDVSQVHDLYKRCL
jgi:hypothetical protein